MSPTRPRRPRSRLLPLVLVAILGASVAAVAPAPSAPVAQAADALTIGQAEARMVALLNQDRAGAGLTAYRVDARLSAIARARSVNMATYDYLSHTQPDGRKFFDYLNDAGITWYGAGEIIAWNTWPDLASSAAAANQGWLGSSSHRAVIMSSDYNYVGVGVAQASNGRFYWTAIAIKGPDRTGAVGRMRDAARATGSAVDGRLPVRITWAGADVRLQVLTAGLRNFDVQLRRDGGSWSNIWLGTTSTSQLRYFAPGHVYEFRVRARDNRGNVGGWSTPDGLRI